MNEGRIDVENSEYKIVFEKLKEELQGDAVKIELSGNKISEAELDEIAELRRVILEVTEEDFSRSYTTT